MEYHCHGKNALLLYREALPSGHVRETGKWKYLESPLLEAQPGMAWRIAVDVMATVRAAVGPFPVKLK